jgi:hypothetical protein
MRSQRRARQARAALGALGLLGAVGCESMVIPVADVGRDDAPITTPLGVASNANPAVFEGQAAVVSVLTVEGADLDGASVVSESPHLEVLDYACAAERCAVVVAVPDIEPDVGRSIPAPIDASNRYLRIVQTGNPDRRALFSVAPLDAIANLGDAATIRGNYFAASVSSVATTMFRGALGREPVRWFVFGDAMLRGVIDVSADHSEPGPGGFAASTSAAANGAAGSATRGGGGGGSAMVGGSGEGAPPAAGGAAFALGCASDGFNASCGGGAGGAGDAGAAAGGGTFTLIVLGTLDADASIDARGADGVDGGGGGGGGRVFVAGSRRLGEGISVETSGGAGAARSGSAGGDGSDGEADLDRASLTTPERWIVRDASLVISGRSPMGRIEFERIDGSSAGAADVAADGTFSVEVSLIEGLNRLRAFVVLDGSRTRLWSGNHFELERRGTQIVPIGGLLDVAYLP